MDRAYSPHASRAVKDELAQLLASQGNVPSYRDAMTTLGRRLGQVIARTVPREDRVIVACGVEDADYVARGVVEVLEEHVGARRVRVACFWNARTRTSGPAPFEQAPIIRQYVEPHTRAVPHVVMVKSVIATSCAVRTNLAQLLETVRPRVVYVAAPVIHRDAPENLAREFEPETARKLRYVYFARDSRRDRNRMIVPGIGGSVYELLGLGNAQEKNNITPALVTERRRVAERLKARAAS